MKKIFMALMAVAAIVLSSCSHETCTLNVVNEYNKKAIVLFSENPQCASLTEATLVADVEPGHAVSQKNVKLNDLNAVIYIATSEVSIDDLEAYKRVGHMDLNEFVGSAVVTVTVTADGMYGVKASNM